MKGAAGEPPRDPARERGRERELERELEHGLERWGDAAPRPRFADELRARFLAGEGAPRAPLQALPPGTEAVVPAAPAASAPAGAFLERVLVGWNPGVARAEFRAELRERFLAAPAQVPRSAAQPGRALRTRRDPAVRRRAPRVPEPARSASWRWRLVAGGAAAAAAGLALWFGLGGGSALPPVTDPSDLASAPGEAEPGASVSQADVPRSSLLATSLEAQPRGEGGERPDELRAGTPNAKAADPAGADEPASRLTAAEPERPTRPDRTSEGSTSTQPADVAVAPGPPPTEGSAAPDDAQAAGDPPVPGWRLAEGREVPPGARVDGVELASLGAADLRALLARPQTIETGEEALTLVRGDALVVELAGGARADLSNACGVSEPARLQIRVDAGSARFLTLAGFQSRGLALDVVSPHVVASVTGTCFAIDVYAELTCVCCAEGELEVRGAPGCNESLRALSEDRSLRMGQEGARGEDDLAPGTHHHEVLARLLEQWREAR